MSSTEFIISCRDEWYLLAGQRCRRKSGMTDIFSWKMGSECSVFFEEFTEGYKALQETSGSGRTVDATGKLRHILI